VTPLLDVVRAVQIAIYGILMGSALYMVQHAYHEYRGGNDRFGGQMWLTVVWLETGLFFAGLTGAVGRFQALHTSSLDLRLWLTFFVQGSLLVGQYRSFKLVKRWHGEGGAR
jgi:hypothetical protein